MWQGFDSKAYTRDEFAARIAGLNWTTWVPRGITIHNTAAPTLAQWVERGAKRDARIANLQHFYEVERGWSAGPHFFIGRELINGFSNPLRKGVHASCFNSTYLGLEMTGDFDSESFAVGDGAQVRDTAVFAVARLLERLELAANASTINFHRQCTKDQHACPGRNVDSAEFIYRVQIAMGEKKKDIGPLPALASSATDVKAIQKALKAAKFDPGPLDGLRGTKTIDAIKAFQIANKLKIDGIAGPKTLALLFPTK